MWFGIRKKAPHAIVQQATRTRVEASYHFRQLLFATTAARAWRSLLLNPAGSYSSAPRFLNRHKKQLRRLGTLRRIFETAESSPTSCGCGARDEILKAGSRGSNWSTFYKKWQEFKLASISPCARGACCTARLGHTATAPPHPPPNTALAATRRGSSASVPFIMSTKWATSMPALPLSVPANEFPMVPGIRRGHGPYVKASCRGRINCRLGTEGVSVKSVLVGR